MRGRDHQPARLAPEVRLDRELACRVDAVVAPNLGDDVRGEVGERKFYGRYASTDELEYEEPLRVGQIAPDLDPGARDSQGSFDRASSAGGACCCGRLPDSRERIQSELLLQLALGSVTSCM